MPKTGLKLIVWLMLLLWGCAEGAVKPADESQKPAELKTTPKEPGLALAAPKDLKLEDKTKGRKPAPKPSVQLERKALRATLAYELPQGWTMAKSGPSQVFFQPPTALEMEYLKVGCRVGIGQAACIEACTTERIAEIIEKSWAKWRQGWEAPHKGKTAADDVKATLKEGVGEKKGALEMRSAQVTYTDDAKRRRPVKDRFLTRCTVHNPKDTLYAEAICRGGLKDEAILKAVFKSLCTSLEVTQLEDPKEPEGPKKKGDDAPARAPGETLKP